MATTAGAIAVGPRVGSTLRLLIQRSTLGAGRVGIRQEIADGYVVMRLAELVAEQRIGAIVESAVANFGGNGGCLALQKLAAALVSTLEPIGSHPAATEVRNLWSKAHRD